LGRVIDELPFSDWKLCAQGIRLGANNSGFAVLALRVYTELARTTGGFGARVPLAEPRA
jgi:hypothetical protein